MSTAPAPTIRRLVPLLLLLAMVGPLTLNILQPSMPGLAATLGAPKESVQLTLSLYILGMAFAQLIAGPLADRYGRRPVVLVALLVYIAASFAANRADTIHLLIIARIAQALGGTACLTLSRTIIADVSDRATTARIIATVTMVMVLAPMASPNIGSYLDTTFGWPSIFLFCVGFGLVTLVASMIFLRETRPVAMQGSTFGDVGRRSLALIRNTAFLRYAGIASFASAAFFIMLGSTPYLVINAMGTSPAEFGRWYIVLGVGYALGNFTVTRNGHRIAMMIRLGNIFLFIGVGLTLALALVPIMHPAAVFLPAVFITYGNGLVMPNSMAAAIQTDRSAGGAASGLMGFSQMLIGAAGSYIAGLLPNQTALGMAGLMLFCGIMASILTARG